MITSSTPAEVSEFDAESKKFATKIEFAINEARIPASMLLGLIEMVKTDLMAQVMRLGAQARTAESPESQIKAILDRKPTNAEMQAAMDAAAKHLGQADDKIQ